MCPLKALVENPSLLPPASGGSRHSLAYSCMTPTYVPAFVWPSLWDTGPTQIMQNNLVL